MANISDPNSSASKADQFHDSTIEYRLLLEQIPAVTYVAALDEYNTRVYTSPQIQQLLGFAAEEVVADPELWFNQIYANDRAEITTALTHSREYGTTLDIEYRMLKKVLRIIWVHDEAVVIRDRDGNPKFLHGLVRDVTERKEAEEALRESEERFHVLADASFEGIAIHEKGIILEINRALEALALSDVSKLIGRPFMEFVVPEDRTRIQERVNAGYEGYAETTLIREDGTRIPVEAMIRSLPYQGRTVNVVALRDLTERMQMEKSLRRSYDGTLEGWSRALDLRDKETEGHTQRVVELTLRLAPMMGIPGEEIVHIRRGALLHDIGKMGIPDAILFKPSPLTEQEKEIMQQHPSFAYELLFPIEYLKPALDIPYCHHEKWDGTGYPRGLKGEEIPLSARIFAVVDVWDALTSDRPYRKAWIKEKALEYIKEQSGKYFDPEVVVEFLRFTANTRLTSI